ncbi:MAG: peptidoglycan bridge formation glycyltransferase FemA/FemB family protein [Armatimonadetes bacterium]|nr:peptidoglycan bridge formation glycyltransferase FemA/FemB family protein [Armatimonadota bacterium]
MQVHSVAESDRGAFHEFIRQSPYGDVLQTAAWARLKSASGWKAHYLRVGDEADTVAACVALERRLPRVPFTLLYCPRGPVLNWNTPDALVALTDALKGLARKRRAILVKIDPPVPADTPGVREALRRAGFRHIESAGFGGTQPRCVMKLDLSAGLDQVFESFKPKWRYNVRLAERKGVVVREGGAQDVDTFYDILLETAKRDRFLVRGREYFHSMWRELSADRLIRVFLAEYEGQTISGALLYVLGKQAWYTYGASSNEHRNVMPNHLMQWRMMQAAAEAGCAVYDFRGVSCNQEAAEDDHLQGLNRFKAGFNAQFVEYVGEYDLPVSRAMYTAWTKVAPVALGMLKKRAAASEIE